MPAARLLPEDKAMSDITFTPDMAFDGVKAWEHAEKICEREKLTDMERRMLIVCHIYTAMVKRDMEDDPESFSFRLPVAN
jgi:hypothetical protein